MNDELVDPLNQLDGVSLPTGAPSQPLNVAGSPASARGLALILGALSSGSLAIDMYLPAFPRIARELGTSIGMVQFTLAIFVLGLAAGQAFWGTLSDHVGRRRPIFAGCGLFSCAAVVCAVTHNIHTLIAARFLMGFGCSAGIVVCRAIVRDMFEEVEAAKFYTMMMVAMAVAPIVAPLLGSMLLTYFNWRAIFWFLTVYGVFCLTGVLRYCPETLAREERMRGHVIDVFRGYGRVLTNRRFLVHAMAFGCTSGILFTYLSSASYLFIELFRIPVAVFGFLFATNSIGFYIVSQLNHLLLRKFASGRLVRGAVWIIIFSAMLLTVCSWTGFGGFPLFFGIFFVCFSTLGIIFPNAAAITMQPFASEAGSASAVMGIVQYILGSIAGSLVGVFQNGTALPVSIQILCFGLVAQGMLLLYRTAPGSR